MSLQGVNVAKEKKSRVSGTTKIANRHISVHTPRTGALGDFMLQGGERYHDGHGGDTHLMDLLDQGKEHIPEDGVQLGIKKLMGQ